MRRFVREALVQLESLSDHVTTWMAEEPDPREDDLDHLTARQWVLIHAGYVTGSLHAGLAATEGQADMVPRADLDAAVENVKDAAAEVIHSHAERDEWKDRATSAESRHEQALAQCARVEQRAAAAEMAQGARSDEMCRYITAICLRKEGGVTGPFSADETEAKESVWALSSRLSAADRERDEARADAQRTDGHLRDAVAETHDLRARLAAAERNATLAEAARNTWLDKANEQHDRLAATERVVEAAQRMQRYNRSDPLNAALDALAPAALKGSGHVSAEFAASVSPAYDTPAAAVYDPATMIRCEGCGSTASANADVGGWRYDTDDGIYTCPKCAAKLDVEEAAAPASTKPDTCGGCFHVDSIDGCKFVGVNPPPRSYGPNMKACAHFTRRLPVVAEKPARTCGECKDMGRLHCERYATSCTAWPAASDPACPAFVGKDGGK